MRVSFSSFFIEKKEDMNLRKQSVVKRKKKPTIFIPFIIAIFVAFFFYAGSVKKAEEIVKPVQVPVAAQTLEEHEVITEEVIQVKELPHSSVPPNALLNPDELIGKLVNTKSTIPANSMFLKETVAALEDIPSRIGMMLEEDQLGLTMRVDLEKSVANSITDGMEVQVRFFTNSTPSGKAFEGVLEERIKVLAVRDSRGEDVTGPIYDPQSEEAENSDRGNRVPTIVVFEATDEQASYLLRAQQLGDLNILAVSEENEESLDEEGTVTQGREELEGLEIDEDATHVEKQREVREMIEKLEEEGGEEAERQIAILESYEEELKKQSLPGHGERYTGNAVKLFIDAMTHTLEDQFEDGTYFVTPDNEIVVYDEELNELRYFENRERFEGSKYVLQEMSDAELDAYFEKIQEDGKNDKE